MSRRCFFPLLVGLIVTTTAVGCGKSGAKKLDVSGTVKFDGKDVAEGDIIFVPENTAIGAEGGKIKDGKYTIKAPEGKCKVQITANRPIPGKKGPMGEDAIEQYIPEKYNEKTTLAAEVSTGKLTHDFDLKP